MDEGEAYKVMGTFQDVTQLKKNEEKIKSQNEELKKLTETRDKLYSVIAHDLKGAFVGILGMQELLISDLEDTPINEKTKHKLQRAYHATENGHQLLENLLEWIQYQTASLKADFQQFDLARLMESIICLLHSMADNKDITIQTRYDVDTLLEGDIEMISTIFRNLISNAIKFSHPGNTVEVSVKEDSDTVTVSVRDEGVGMSDEIRSSLFDPEHRPKRKGTKSEKGTGLGLLLCKEMVDIHHGEIDVRSEVSEGSEFIVTFPKFQ